MYYCMVWYSHSYQQYHTGTQDGSTVASLKHGISVILLNKIIYPCIFLLRFDLPARNNYRDSLEKTKPDKILHQMNKSQVFTYS
jgi:hypothetical protein